MKLKIDRGFTLIELLVVIAIIGILSAVVLASLNTARSKGNDATIKSNLSTVLTQSVMYYDTNMKYGTNAAAAGPTSAACTLATSMFFLDANVKAAIAQADQAAGGTAGTISKTICAIEATGSSQDWAVYVPLFNNTGSNTGFCIDSRGMKKADTVPTAGTYLCP